jgi:hypothetical protein
MRVSQKKKAGRAEMLVAVNANATGYARMNVIGSRTSFVGASEHSFVLAYIEIYQNNETNLMHLSFNFIEN